MRSWLWWAAICAWLRWLDMVDVVRRVAVWLVPRRLCVAAGVCVTAPPPHAPVERRHTLGDDTLRAVCARRAAWAIGRC